MSPVHGKRVVGSEAYDKAVREEVGGVHTFGKRVRGAIPEAGPTNTAKRVTEHGPLVVNNATMTDSKGKEGDGVSVEEIRNILAENPTFFDSLFEAELARPDGARPDALAIFYEVERGIKGQARQDVMEEIQTLIGAKRQSADANANRNQIRLQQREAQQKRMDENTLLTDADRLSALADRQESLQRIQDAGGSDQLKTVTSASVETQMKDLANEQGVDIGSTTGGSVQGSVPTKPDGSINPETQTSGARLGVPKGDPGTGNGSTSTQLASSDTGSTTETSTIGDSKDDEVDFETYTKAELEEYLGKDHSGVKGTGADGAVLKADLVKAAKKKQSKGR